MGNLDFGENGGKGGLFGVFSWFKAFMTIIVTLFVGGPTFLLYRFYSFPFF